MTIYCVRSTQLLSYLEKRKSSAASMFWDGGGNYCAMSHPDGFCWSQSLTGCCNHHQQLWDALNQHEHRWINFSTVEVSVLEFSWWWWHCNLWLCWNWLYFLACTMKILGMKNVYSQVWMIKKNFASLKI